MRRQLCIPVEVEILLSYYTVSFSSVRHASIHAHVRLHARGSPW